MCSGGAIRKGESTEALMLMSLMVLLRLVTSSERPLQGLRCSEVVASQRTGEATVTTALRVVQAGDGGVLADRS